MQYVKHHTNNHVIEYPANPRMDYTYISFPDGWEGGQIANTDFVYSLVNTTALPNTSMAFVATEGTPTFNGNGWYQTWTTSLAPRETIRQKVRDYRYFKEIAGVQVGNNYFMSDRESQTKYLAMAVDLGQQTANSLATWSVNWQTANNTFVELNAAQMSAVVTAVRNHVQECFDRQSELYEILDTANDAVVANTNYTTGWPA